MQNSLEAERPLISVIVPVYRAEAYLDRCVRSICRQSYPYLDILLVDDGSPDRCGELCDRWAARDTRVRVLHKENGGLSDARNRGVGEAAGDYVSFVDADDYLAPDAIEYLLGLLEENSAEIACGGFRAVEDGGEDFAAQPRERVLRFTGRAAVQALLGTEHDAVLVTAWGKLLRTGLARCNPFPVGRLHEDEAVTYRYYDQSRRVVLGNRAIYAYFQNPEGITHTRTRKNRTDTLCSWEEQCAYFARRGEEDLAAAAADRFVNVLVDQADRGDAVCQSYLRAGSARPLLRRRLRFKTRVRYYGYRLLGTDLNKRYHRLFGARAK